MSGRRSRNKGATFERWVANQLKPYFPNARRGIGQARSAKEVCDVEGTPWWIECKRRRRCSVTAAIKQAEEQTDGRPLLIVTKDDHAPVQVTFRIPLMKEAWGTVQEHFQGYRWMTTSWEEFLTLLTPYSSETSSSSTES